MSDHTSQIESKVSFVHISRMEEDLTDRECEKIVRKHGGVPARPATLRKCKALIDVSR